MNGRVLRWNGVKVTTVCQWLWNIERLLPNAKKSVSSAVAEQPELADVTPDVKPRFFALVVGIDKYEHAGSGFSSLRGAVADANDMNEFLTATMGVDPGSIRNLRNGEATRQAIIKAFYDLKEDERIKKDDPILIFYAGHGSQTSAPQDWEAGGRDALIQMILPHNFWPETTDDMQMQGIPDLTLAELLSQVASEKGDNITVMFDCCHSGSSTRDPLELGLMSRGITLPQNYEVLPTIDQDILRDHRKAKVANGFEVSGTASHVLLAACSERESSYESSGRGHFTHALLEFLRDPAVRTDNVTAQGVIEQLRDLPRQHPQCEGKNRSRLLFDGKAPVRSSMLYSVKLTDNGVITLGGGQAHGISEGAEFDVFTSKDIDAQPECRLIATAVSACSAIMTKVTASTEQHIPDEAIPQPAWALQTKMGTGADLAVAVPLDHELHGVLTLSVEAMSKGSYKRSIRFVDWDEQHCELKVVIEGNLVAFYITDKICVGAGLARLPYTISLSDKDTIYFVLESAADFFYHLRRSNKDTLLANKMSLEAFELETRYNLKEHMFMLIAKEGQNLVQGGMMQLEIDSSPFNKTKYGLKLTSEVDRDLYVWVFMFDMCDFSIEAIYKPNCAKSGADPSVKAKGSLSIGYGAGGIQPQTFYLPERMTVDVTYLKVFITSEPVDLSHIAQETPFEGDGRKGKSVALPQLAVWDTMLVAIVQKAKQV